MEEVPPAVFVKTPRPSRFTWLAVLVVGLAAILPFLSTLHAYFIGDDFGLIQLFSGKPPLHVLTLFTSSWTERIYGELSADELRPLVALSYQLDALWGAASPIAYHVTNIVLHLLNTLLVFTIGRTVAGLRLPAATFAGLVFAVLPAHAETVAWISGRADSIPTLFYLASFLAYATWRQRNSNGLYAASVGLFFLALFSKQSAITMVATLVLYDVLVERRPLVFSVSSLRGYLAFGVLTISYLVLRYVLFGNAVREEQITVQTVTTWAVRQATYLQMMFLGLHSRGDTITSVLAMAGIACTFLPLYGEVRNAYRGSARTSGSLLLYFGPVWWLLGLAPLVVTYFSARHLYLPSAGCAIALALGLEALWSTRRGLWRYAQVLGAAGVVLGYALVLRGAVTEWNSAAAISQKILSDVERVATVAPAGTLLVVGAPAVGANPAIWTWLWGFALPYALQPPFTQTDPAERMALVSHPWVYCCPVEQWFAVTRQVIAAWSRQADGSPIIILVWSAYDGALTQYSDRDDPQLRSKVVRLADADTPGAMTEMLEAILRQVGGS